ncbi:hypothetical protein A8709_06510 [Paenibacillus pectinilyticus]|uniref:Uncharacterized protein n=1 Tax=Paenibacillus pectinilyticus TaxID=512399 RepID=A0A1C0ZTB6_9BACL|nr:hypothetical protein A8709_06510 [Paenibacillus pectinilyticus]
MLVPFPSCFLLGDTDHQAAKSSEQTTSSKFYAIIEDISFIEARLERAKEETTFRNDVGHVNVLILPGLWNGQSAFGCEGERLGSV